MYNRIALELIQFQNKDEFPDRLTSVVTSIYKDIDSNKYSTNEKLLKESKDITRITQLIKDRFNLTVVIEPVLSNSNIAAIYPFMSDYLLNTNSLNNATVDILSKTYGVNKEFKAVEDIVKEKNKIHRNIHGKKGSVDFKNARVYGYLAETKHFLLINFYALKDIGLTPGEISAIILHELGHAFVGLSKHHRLTTTNSIILDIVEELNGNNKDKAYFIYKKHFDKKDMEKAQLGSDKELPDFYGKVARQYIEVLSSEFINDSYDKVDFEATADDFATKFGMGKEIVSGLDKVSETYGYTTSSKGLYYLLVFTEATIGSLLLGVLGVSGGLIGLAALTILFGNKSDTTVYDFPIERYERVKRGIANNLKDRSLPKSVTKDLLDQYKFVDDVIKNTNHFKGILNILGDTFIPKVRSGLYYSRLQQTIEVGLNNELFVRASQLKIQGV